MSSKLSRSRSDGDSMCHAVQPVQVQMTLALFHSEWRARCPSRMIGAQDLPSDTCLSHDIKASPPCHQCSCSQDRRLRSKGVRPGMNSQAHTCAILDLLAFFLISRQDIQLDSQYLLSSGLARLNVPMEALVAHRC